MFCPDNADPWKKIFFVKMELNCNEKFNLIVWRTFYAQPSKHIQLFPCVMQNEFESIWRQNLIQIGKLSVAEMFMGAA